MYVYKNEGTSEISLTSLVIKRFMSIYPRN